MILRLFSIAVLQFCVISYVFGAGAAPQITKLNVQCDRTGMKVNVEFDNPFNGIIFSKGHYSDPSCRWVKESSTRRMFNFYINLSGCGTISTDMSSGNSAGFKNVIIIQNDPEYQDIMDSARKLSCDWVTRLEKFITFAPFGVDMLGVKELRFPGDTVDCWMDIQRGHGPFSNSVGGVVPIGEKLTVVIYVKDTDSSFDVHVKDCYAYDRADYRNSEARAIKLTDDKGCSAKNKLVQGFYRTRDVRNTGATIIAYGLINAFKFPERMDVFLACNVEVCKGSCPNQECQPEVAVAGDADDSSSSSGTCEGCTSTTEASSSTTDEEETSSEDTSESTTDDKKEETEDEEKEEKTDEEEKETDEEKKEDEDSEKKEESDTSESETKDDEDSKTTQSKDEEESKDDEESKDEDSETKEEDKKSDDDEEEKKSDSEDAAVEDEKKEEKAETKEADSESKDEEEEEEDDEKLEQRKRSAKLRLAKRNKSKSSRSKKSNKTVRDVQAPKSSKKSKSSKTTSIQKAAKKTVKKVARIVAKPGNQQVRSAKKPRRIARAPTAPGQFGARFASAELYQKEGRHIRTRRSLIVTRENATFPAMMHSISIISPVEDLDEKELKAWERMIEIEGKAEEVSIFDAISKLPTMTDNSFCFTKVSLLTASILLSALIMIVSVALSLVFIHLQTRSKKIVEVVF